MDRAENLRRIKEQASLPKQPKIRKPIAKVSEKKKRQLQEEKATNKSKGGGEKERWFKERRREMVGFCKNCNKPSFKKSDEYFHFSIAHILAKRKSMFPSVATHPENWVELCADCHHDLDNCMIDLSNLACWDEIVIKFQKLYPFIAPEERRRIPDILLKYLKTDM